MLLPFFATNGDSRGDFVKTNGDLRKHTVGEATGL